MNDLSRVFLVGSVIGWVAAAFFVVAMFATRERGGGPLAFTAGVLLSVSLALDITAGVMLSG